MPSFETFFPVLCGTVAAGAAVTSGLWLTERFRTMGREYVQVGLAMSAGFLLSVVLLDIIPECAEDWKGRPGGFHTAMLLVLAGYLFVIFLERAVLAHVHVHFEPTIEPHESHCDSHPHIQHGHNLLDDSHLPTLLSALVVHAFFDGVSVASAFLLNKALGWVIFIALLLHKVPDGVTVVSVVLAAGRSRRVARLATLVTGGATLLGAILVVFMQPIIPVVGYVLPVAAGVTLHVAASDLVPEIVSTQRGLRTPMAILSGVVLFYCTHFMLEWMLG
ncbi:MAG: ZIP family metal transporter [Blastocatellia bacterium]|nr:ZIP family metal transporter [Blastocatellia bacterium]